MKDVFDGTRMIQSEKKVASDELDKVRLHRKFDDYLEYYKDNNEFVDKAKFMPATMPTKFESNLRAKYGIDCESLNVSIHKIQEDMKSFNKRLRKEQRDVNRVSIFKPSSIRKYELKRLTG